MVRVRCQFLELWDLPGYCEKSNTQEAYLRKTGIPGQIVSDISSIVVGWLRTNPSKFEFDLGLNV